jgi:hypothetical protein
MMIIASILLLAGAANIPAPLSVPADGKKHKVNFENNTYKVTINGDQISVHRAAKIFKNNTSAEVRAAMRKVAIEISKCRIKDEYFTFWTFTLEATIDCDVNK